MDIKLKAKIYEALTALASMRVTMGEENAQVVSSDLTKTYIVRWRDDLYSSTDSASFWQGYPGYPIIAVLFLQKKLDYDEDMATYLKDINWHQINAKYKRDYQKSLDEVLASFDLEIQERLKKLCQCDAISII